MAMLRGVIVNTAKKPKENASVTGNFQLGAQETSVRGALGGQKEPTMKAWGQHSK